MGFQDRGTFVDYVKRGMTLLMFDTDGQDKINIPHQFRHS